MKKCLEFEKKMDIHTFTDCITLAQVCFVYGKVSFSLWQISHRNLFGLSFILELVIKKILADGIIEWNWTFLP